MSKGAINNKQQQQGTTRRTALRDLEFCFSDNNNNADENEGDGILFPETASSSMRGNNNNNNGISRSSFCRNATAHGKYVYGLPTTQTSNNNKYTWKTQLSSDIVSLSCSSKSQQLIVAATGTGDVSLLRADDGAVLVTRNVVGSQNNNVKKEEEEEDYDYENDDIDDQTAPLLVEWIPTAAGGVGSEKQPEALLIENRLMTSSNGKTDDAEEEETTHFLLISNLESLLEDDNEQSSQSQQSQQLRITNFALPKGEIRAITGCRTDCSQDSLLRFLVCTADGTVSAYDYNNDSKKVTTVKESVPLGTNNNNNESSNSSGNTTWYVDYNSGIVPVSLHDNCNYYVVVCVYSPSENKTALLCLDMVTLQVASSRYELDPTTILFCNNGHNQQPQPEGTTTPAAAAAAANSSTTTPRGNINNSTPGDNSTTTTTTFSTNARNNRRRNRRRRDEPQRPKVLTIEPVTSCNSKVDTIAIAVAVESSSSSSVHHNNNNNNNSTRTVLVLQWIVEETMGLRILSSRPHLMYSIPLSYHDDQVAAAAAGVVVKGGVELAAIQHQDGEETPYYYGFNIKLWSSQSHHPSCSDDDDGNSSSNNNTPPPIICSYKAFCPASGRQVGEMGRLMESGSFDQVDSILKKELEGGDGATADIKKYACITPGQVAWKRLETLLRQGRQLDDPSTQQQAQDCFRKLATCAISSLKNDSAAASSSDGLRYLLEASDAVVRALPEQEPRLDVITMVLKALVTTLGTVQKAMKSGSSSSSNGLDQKRQEVERQKKSLEDRLLAIQFLAKIVEENSHSVDDQEGNGDLHKEIRFDGPFRSVRSPSHLFEVLVRHGYFSVAENFYRSSSTEVRQEWLTTEVLVRSVLRLGRQNGSNKDYNDELPPQPRRYCSLLSEVVLPSLSLGHELFGAIRTWACRTADALEAKDSKEKDCSSIEGLEAAILLLKVVDRGTKNLQVAVHSSFAVSDPFVDREGTWTSLKRSIHNRTVGGDLSISGDTSSLSSPAVAPVTPTHLKSSRQHSVNGQDGVHPIPTILELGALKRGATKSRLRAVGASTADDGEETCVEDKLRDAMCLKQARRAGLQNSVVSLRSFIYQGGALFVAKELVSLLSRKNSGIERDNTVELFLTETVKPFCADFGVDYDKALLEYVEARCRVKTRVDEAVQESSLISKCCSSDIMKTHAALAVLRASLLCKTKQDWLTQFSKDALLWASSDSTLQSEVQEASRLLQIDAIVLKYCGAGARQLFQIDNPAHAVRLMEFVTRHVHEESVLSDALQLCDAYLHLNACDAGCLLLEHAVLQCDPDLCTTFMSQIYSHDSALAEKVLAGIVTFTEELLKESSTRSMDPDRIQQFRQQGISASECAGAVVQVVLQHTRTISAVAAVEIQSVLRNNSLESLHQDLMRINRLQSEFGICMSLSDLSSPKRIVDSVTELLGPVMDACSSKDHDRKGALNIMVARARRACSLLVGMSTKDANELWIIVCAKAIIKLIEKHGDEDIIEIMELLGMFDSNQTDVTALLPVALALCKEASTDMEGSDSSQGMQRIVKAASLLHDRALSYAADSQLPATVSFGALVETVYEMLARTDEGLGEEVESLRQSTRDQVWKQTLPPCLKEAHSALNTTDLPVPLRRSAALHKSWYIGDGLLLPPRETLGHSLHFCKNIMGDVNASPEVMEFLRRSGAHFLSLRVLTSTVIHFTTYPIALSKRLTNIDFGGLAADASNAAASLAERSLGGTSQVGITSGLIDSQLAVAFLLSLRTTKAFKMYKSSLPTALKSHNYKRLLTLATIGKETCSSNTQRGSFSSVGWKGQGIFFEQCQTLATRAKWWAKLREYGVKFEPHRFDENNGTDGNESPNYAASLIFPAVQSMSTVYDSSDTLEILTRYALAFGLSRELVVQKQIEFYLSPVVAAGGGVDATARDVRLDLNKVESIVEASLSLVDSPLKRREILRRCLVNLESSAASTGRDYERFSLVLAFYHEALIEVLDQDPAIGSSDIGQLEIELELVDRRRDVNAILSSFFRDRTSEDRPDFRKFFVPLDDSNASDLPIRHVLGRINGSTKEAFDPLEPLEKVLSGSLAAAATAALAPMCISLGLPQGFLHARSLILKFLRASNGITNYPSYENGVLPVLNRLRSSGERTELAEWCATKYPKNDEEKLKCLNVALKYAMEYSSAMEHSSSQIAVQKALETVKRISSAKAALSDILRVKAILKGATLNEGVGVMASIIEDIVEKLDSFVQDHPSTPENLIDFLLSMGSLIAVNAALDNTRPLSIIHLRELCKVVHQACKAICEQHSHVQSGHHSRRLARRWLFYGDDSSMAVAEEKESHNTADAININTLSTTALAGIQEDETVNFVMDLADLHNEHDWEAAEGPLLAKKKRFTSEEEPSSIKATSFREESEAGASRAAIRIAFVLAFSDESVTKSRGLDSENSVPKSNQSHSSNGKTKRLGLLAKHESKKDSRQEQQVLGHSRELLRTAFAKASSSTNLFNCSVNFDDSIHHTARDAPDTVTFAMRHRALRAASILCPQEALERVIHDEGFLDGVNIERCPLKTCAFGAFVAKEIEEMGLSLPHSDLGHISSMHYPSYARTLWRDHRDGDQKGRMLLNQLEMLLRSDLLDISFINSLLEEMTRLHLPRTLLLALERIAMHEDSRLVSQQTLVGPVLFAAVSTLEKAIISEARRTITTCTDADDSVSNADDVDTDASLQCTIQRLGSVAVAFSTCGEGQTKLAELGEALIDLSHCSTENKFLSDGIQSTLLRILRRLRKDLRPSLLTELNGNDEDGRSDEQPEATTETSNQSLMNSFQRLEASLAYYHNASSTY